ncbi:MAG: hypothetical protein SVO01_00790 [Thermotogota bacterium]|nr:hypothetical protein [Thermotogota bacterium]
MEKMPIVLPNDDGIRPIGGPNKCTFCQQKVGTPHKANCVILSKKVKIKYSFELEIEMPWSWTKDEIEFSRGGGSSWCANNALEELEELSNKLGCLCSIFSSEVLEMSEEPPYRRDKNDNIVKD